MSRDQALGIADIRERESTTDRVSDDALGDPCHLAQGKRWIATVAW